MTVNDPFDPAIVPVEVVPSPQSIVATKSLASAAVSVSVNVATVTLLSSCPGSPDIVLPWAASTSCSMTVTSPMPVTTVASEVRMRVALSVKSPSSA